MRRKKNYSNILKNKKRRKKLFDQHDSTENEEQISAVVEVVDEVEKNGSLSEQSERNVPDESESLKDHKKNGSLSEQSESNEPDESESLDAHKEKEESKSLFDDDSSSSSKRDKDESSDLSFTLTSGDATDDEGESVYSCRITENDEVGSFTSSETVTSVEELSDLFETDSSEEDDSSASVKTSDFSDEDYEEEETSRKKQKTKNRAIKEQKKRKPKKRRGKKQKNPKPKIDKLNEYEKQIEKNKEERMTFLSSLRINDVKEGLKEAIQTLKPAKRKFIERVIPPRECLSRRAKINIDLSEKAVEERAVSGDTTYYQRREKRADSYFTEIAAEARVLRRERDAVFVVSPDEKTHRSRRRLDDLSEKAIFVRNLSKTKQEAKKISRHAAHYKLRREATDAERFRRWAVMKIPTVVFNHRLKKFVKDKSPLQLGVLLNRLPGSCCLEECLAAESSFLAWKYSLSVDHRRMDMKLLINNLRQRLQLPRWPTLKIPTVVFSQRAKKPARCKSQLQLCVLLNRLPASSSLQKCLAADNYFLSWKRNICYMHRPIKVTDQDISLDISGPRRRSPSPVGKIKESKRNESLISSHTTPKRRSTRSCCPMTVPRILFDKRAKKPSEDESQLHLGVLLNQLPSSSSGRTYGS